MLSRSISYLFPKTKVIPRLVAKQVVSLQKFPSSIDRHNSSNSYSERRIFSRLKKIFDMIFEFTHDKQFSTFLLKHMCNFFLWTSRNGQQFAKRYSPILWDSVLWSHQNYNQTINFSCSVLWSLGKLNEECVRELNLSLALTLSLTP